MECHFGVEREERNRMVFLEDMKVICVRHTETLKKEPENERKTRF
jgi:hypothetical protein